MSRVIVVSGPPAAGKTTTSGLLAARFERGVHLKTDWFFEAIRSGFIEPWRTEAHEQNAVVVRAVAEAARVYAIAGYTVLVDGVVFPWALAIYREVLARDGIEPEFVVLLPRVELLLERGPGRARDREPDLEALRSLHRQFAESGLITIDNSQMTPAEAAEAVLAVIDGSEEGR